MGDMILNYRACGAECREDWLRMLANENGLPFGTVQRLADAGMVMLGKTNTDEFAIGSSTENSGYANDDFLRDIAEQVPGLDAARHLVILQAE